jgi:hypothetical protein
VIRRTRACEQEARKALEARIVGFITLFQAKCAVTGDFSYQQRLTAYICQGDICLLKRTASNRAIRERKIYACMHTCMQAYMHTAWLHTKQALQKGGSFILKMFTILRPESVSLLALLCCFFDHVTVTKPEASRPGNSEVIYADVYACMYVCMLCMYDVYVCMYVCMYA